VRSGGLTEPRRQDTLDRADAQADDVVVTDRAGATYAGRMFWLWRNRFAGS
jgi:hypothetical protein